MSGKLVNVGEEKQSNPELGRCAERSGCPEHKGAFWVCTSQN